MILVSNSEQDIYVTVVNEPLAVTINYILLNAYSDVWLQKCLIKLYFFTLFLSYVLLEIKHKAFYRKE